MTAATPITDRMRRHTSLPALRRADDTTRAHIRHFGRQPRAQLTARIEQLDRTWPLDRLLETNASVLAFSGAALGLAVNKKWFLLTGTVLGFLAQHAIQGWCPPVPILRRAGIRTRAELDQERYALKALRGDFRRLSYSGASAREILHVVST